MKRWHWTSLALLGGIFAVALIAVPRFSGGTSHVTAAVVGPALVLDLDITDGCTAPATVCPCATLTDHRTRNVGDTYKIAVCLVNAVSGDPPVAAPPESFGFSLLYDKTLNQCVPGTAGADAKPGLDFNPDANIGTSDFTTPNLGDRTDWDCTANGASKPTCDSTTGNPTVGTAQLGCFAISTAPTLPAGDGVAAPVAEITFHALNGGDDTLVLQGGIAADFPGVQYLQCPDVGTCVGGTEHKVGDTATPTSTPTATIEATSTPTPVCGFAGLPTCTPTPKAHTPTPTITATPTATTGAAAPPAPPPAAPPSGGAGGNVVRPPNTGDGSSSASWGGSLEWMIAGTAVISLAGGAFYLRRVRMRR